MSQHTIWTTYNITVPHQVELPEGKTIWQIDNIQVKWNEADITFDDATSTTLLLEGDPNSNIDDWKRPIEVSIDDDPERGRPAIHWQQ